MPVGKKSFLRDLNEHVQETNGGTMSTYKDLLGRVRDVVQTESIKDLEREFEFT